MALGVRLSVAHLHVIGKHFLGLLWLVTTRQLLYRFDSVKVLGKPSKVFLLAVWCFGRDQSAPDSLYKMTLSSLVLLLSLASLANASPVIFPPPHCGHHWWLDSDGQPTQNLHCGQLFSDPSSTTPSPSIEANQRCSEEEFLCGDGSTCLPFSRLCDEVGDCSTAFHVTRMDNFM